MHISRHNVCNSDAELVAEAFDLFIRVNNLRLIIGVLFLLCIGCSSNDKSGSSTPASPSPIISPAGSSANGGDWQSSGGTGVACFQNEDQAKEFNSEVAARKALSQERIDQIETLVTLERWEAEKIGYPLQFSIGTSTDQILNQLKKRLRKYAALFGYKLEEVEGRLSFDSWKSEYLLASTEDAAPLVEFPMESNCRLIQLAIRYTKSSPLMRMPEAYVSFDSRLWNKLDAEDRAILKLHENIYLLGRLVGHPNARLTRALVMQLLGEDLWKYEDSPGIRGISLSNLQSMVTQNAINFAFGDYVHLIFEDSSASYDIQPYSGSSRYSSLRSLILKMRGTSDACYEAQVKKDSMLCLQVALDSNEVAKSVNHEEAFLMYYRWFVTYQGVNIPDSEIVSLPWTAVEDIEMADNAMELACRHTIDYGGQKFFNEEGILNINPAVVVKAKAYCDEYIRFRTQRPKGTNQN